MAPDDSYISTLELENMGESFAWDQVLDASPLSEYSFEYFSAIDSSSGFPTLAAPPDVACKKESCTIGNFWEMPRSSRLGYVTGLLHDLPPIETVGPGPITDEPLSAISDASSVSINSPSITDSSSPERIRGQSTWNPVSVTQQRKRSLSDCTSSLATNQTRERSASDAYSTFQTFSGTPYGGFQGPSNHSPLPQPAGHHYQPYPTWSQSHSNPDFPAGLPVQFGAEYDYSSTGLYDGDSQGYLCSGDVIGNGQMPITGSHFKAQVASLAVQQAALKKRKNPDGKVFGCDYCGAQLTTKQNLSYHISAHLGKRAFACYKCNKLFNTPHVRNRHANRCRNPVARNV